MGAVTHETCRVVLQWINICILLHLLDFYSHIIKLFISLQHDCTGQQRFWPMRKNVCFWCIFGRWIPICFQNFSITHTFSSRLKGWNLLRQDTKVCFYRGRHEEFKDFLFQEDGVVFCSDVCSVMELEFNPDQCACSLIRRKWACCLLRGFVRTS